MKVKICGLHPARDVQLCIDLGVNFLGFVFYSKSPRNVNLKQIEILKSYNKFNSKFVFLSNWKFCFRIQKPFICCYLV